MRSISFVVCILTCLAAVAASARLQRNPPQKSPILAPVVSPNSAPGPAVDCSSIIFDMVDCIGFLSDGSNDTSPEKSCCSGLESVLKAGEHCICEAIKSSRDMGIELNLTRAASLPSECGLPAPPISQCGISLSPGSAPAGEPFAAPSGAPAAFSPFPAPNKEPLAPEPGTSDIFPGGGGAIVKGPPPSSSHVHAGAYGISTPFSLLIAMLLVSFSYLAM